MLRIKNAKYLSKKRIFIWSKSIFDKIEKKAYQNSTLFGKKLSYIQKKYFFKKKTQLFNVGYLAWVNILLKNGMYFI